MYIRHVVCPLVLSLLSAACDRSDGAWTGTVADSAGIAIVRNPASPLNGTAEAPTVEPVLRIGSAAGDANTQFGLIASIAVSRDGRIFVLDRPSSRVLVFTSDGTFERSIGGPGGGPGELSAEAVNVFVTDRDTLLVADPGNMRINLYTLNGDPAGSIPISSPTGTFPVRFGMLPDGRVVQHVRTMPTPERPELRDDLLVVLGGDGRMRDTLHAMPTGRSIRFRNGVAQFAAYEPEPVWALGTSGRFYTGTNGRYRIEVRDTAGRLSRIIERDHENEPITPADQAAFLRMIRRQMTEQRVDPLMIDEIVSGMSFADRYPAFAYFLPGPRGTLWVQQVRSAREEGEDFDAQQIGSERWDVYDRDGRFLAVTTLPDRFTPLLARDDRFYGYWSDELDVQYIMVVRVQGLPTDAGAAHASSATSRSQT